MNKKLLVKFLAWRYNRNDKLRAKNYNNKTEKMKKILAWLQKLGIEITIQQGDNKNDSPEAKEFMAEELRRFEAEGSSGLPS